VHKRFRIFTVVVAVVASGSLLIGTYAYVFGLGGSGTASAGTLPTFAAQTTAAPTTTTTTKPAPTTTTIPVQRQPTAIKMPDPGHSLGIGSRGPIVLAYEQRLASLHFDPGPVDGVYDQQTAFAIDAVEKIYGIQRDGQVGPQVRFALSAFQWPKPLTTRAEPDRIEISLDKQYLVLYEHNWIRLITTTSTGGGYAFCGGDSGCQYAITPPGRFELQWYFNGWRTSKLGHLYKPYYFHGGIAIHGYTSVPNYPASHGCVRIPMKIADYFHTLVHNGTPVYVVGTPSHAMGVKPPPPRPTTTTVPKVTPTTGAKKPTPTTKPKTTTTTAKKP
jgi:L,D-transpeptidase catalytic domain/Putative peptidoglycan binding domain